jgi:hypothetical protein
MVASKGPSGMQLCLRHQERGRHEVMDEVRPIVHECEQVSPSPLPALNRAHTAQSLHSPMPLSFPPSSVAVHCNIYLSLAAGGSAAAQRVQCGP